MLHACGIEYGFDPTGVACSGRNLNHASAQNLAFAKGLTGIQDAQDCLSKGDRGACFWAITGVNPVSRLAAAGRAITNTIRGSRTTLYIAVSRAELDDIAANGFRASERSMSGKFFAETPEHAAEWGRRLIYGREGVPFHVVKTRVPKSFADRLMRWDKLDGIGPARYVDQSLLDELNRVRSGVWDVPTIPRG